PLVVVRDGSNARVAWMVAEVVRLQRASRNLTTSATCVGLDFGKLMRETQTFQNFSDSQKQALDARRNLAVRANAGSGKTSVLIERIAQILAQSWDDGTPLELTKIVAITFTRKAAAELEDRLRLTFGEW